ncbi:MAG TPA: DUF2470 domain-containing protein [Baekduia sp.]|nr:DUF2470 domain-containing protein [Baekduia sp.]
MNGARRSAAEEARTLVAAARFGALATISADGGPWASVVAYVPLDDGRPVLHVSTLAEHGRNLQRDQRASLVVTEDAGAGDLLDAGRVTLAGRVRRPDEAGAPGAPGDPHGFADFSTWVLEVERVRWVGGFARMDSVDGAAYLAATPDPTGPSAARAVAHLNADHADALLDIARTLAGRPEATAASCVRIDRYGLDLRITAPGGATEERVAFAEPATAPDGLRAATVELTRRARA